MTHLNHNCKHEDIAERNVAIHQSSVAPLATVDGSIRIEYDFSFLDRDALACGAAGQVVQLGNESVQCGADDVLSAAKRTYLQQVVLDDAKQWFQSVLSVARDTAPLTVQTSDCGCGDKNVDLSAFRNRTFADVDLLIVVTARSTRNLDANGATVAFSCPCQVDSSGRATVARINWAPAAILTDRPDLRREHSGVAIHELTHALGFSLQAFQRLPRFVEPVRTVTRTALVNGVQQSHTVTLLNLPVVTEWARTHFGCAALDGVELESQGAVGTASSHWEKRLFNDELMTATTHYAPVISNLTLLFLQETGWYKVDLARAEPLLFGADGGCDFAAPRCDKWPASYICDFEHRRTQRCLWTGTERGRCELIQYSSPLPAWYQYDSEHPNYGGPQLSDYCPVYDRQNFGDCRQPAYQLDRLEMRGELYDSDSRCFPSTLYRDGRTPPTDGELGAGCHAAVCDLRSGRPLVRIGYHWLECAEEMELDGFDGALECKALQCSQLRSVAANEWAVIDGVDAIESDSSEMVALVVRGSRLQSTWRVVVDAMDECNVTRVNESAVECTWINRRSGLGHSLDVTVVRNDSILTTTLVGGLRIGTSETVVIVAVVVSVVVIALVVLAIILLMKRRSMKRMR
jgi:hypothetical protein